MTSIVRRCMKECVNVSFSLWYVFVHTDLHIDSSSALSSHILAFFAKEAELSAPSSGLCWHLAPFLFPKSLLLFLQTQLLLEASSLMSSANTDGLSFCFTSLRFFSPAAVLFFCLLFQGDWTLSWKTKKQKHFNDFEPRAMHYVQVHLLKVQLW